MGGAAHHGMRDHDDLRRRRAMHSDLSRHLAAALRPVVRAGDPMLAELGPAGRSELARLLPELGDSTPHTLDERSGSAQARLFEALLGLLDRLGRDAPVVLSIEDIHWADSST